MDGKLHCLPLRALRHLAVSKQNKRPVGQPVEVFGVKGHSDSNRQALPKGTRGRLGIPEGGGGMALEGASELSVTEKLLLAHSSGGGPERIQERRSVALREYETVVVRMVGLVGVEPEDSAEQKARHELHRRQR